jgi:two-component system chemotaxis sensor kinase CheA
VRAKAVERGLIDADQNLTDEEIDDLIFLPGFSTKDAVTDISGRGVGMDAVRQTIVEMGGRVLVRSEPGRGSRFLLTLPLSLAVLDAMITEVGGHRFLIPVHNVKRTIRPEAQQIIKLDREGAMVSLHGELLRIVTIASEFGIAGGEIDPCRGLLIIVDGAMDQQRVALLVDDLLGQEPVVVKSLERNYRKVPGIAAATILGDGRAALILDLLTLGQGGRRRGSDQHHAAPKREEVA